MRLELSLQVHPGSLLPFNYQYYLSAGIYHILGQADDAFAQRLHEHGYLHAGKRYKLFQFSRLEFPFDAEPGQGLMKIKGNRAVLRLSFLMPEILQNFVAGLFQNKQLHFFDRHFDTRLDVEMVEVLPRPSFQSLARYRLLTPLCLKRDRPDGSKEYLHPDASGYANLLRQNLFNKWQAAGHADRPHPDDEFHFQLLNEPRSKLIQIKRTKVRGWLFDFEMTAPAELHEVGYFAGFGVENSQGFGWGEVLNAALSIKNGE